MTVGPRWLAIGASDAGAERFTELLLRHPDVTVADGADRPKWRQRVRGFLADPLAGGGGAEGDVEAFRSSFGGTGAVGACAPNWLGRSWQAAALQQAAPDAVFVVVLQDPIERFVAQMRRTQRGHARSGKTVTYVDIRSAGVHAVWEGLYATLLEPWQAIRDRVVVVTKEAFERDAAATARPVFEALGVAPIDEAGAGAPEPRRGDGDFELDDHAGLRERLDAIYRRQAERLAAEWGVDVSPWTGGRA